MMKLRGTLFVGVLATLAFVVPTDLVQGQQARRYNWELLDQVEAERNSCAKARDKKASSGVTGEMRSAAIEYGVCVERIIKKVATEFYAPGAFGEGGITARVEEMRMPYQKAYWTMYNDAGPCGSTGCGTMYQVFHAGKWSNLMEGILADMVGHLKDQK